MLSFKACAALFVFVEPRHTVRVVWDFFPRMRSVSLCDLLIACSQRLCRTCFVVE